MINRLLFKLSAGLRCRLITINDKPYLERYYMGELFGVTFYLHRFVSADRERHLHNHPWGWARALVLSGGYDEESVHDLTIATPTGCLIQTRRVNWWNRVNGNHFHRIANAAPGTWTLFFHGPRVQIGEGMATYAKGWGFLERDTDTVRFRPFLSANSNWKDTAPFGRDAGRVPL